MESRERAKVSGLNEGEEAGDAPLVGESRNLHVDERRTGLFRECLCSRSMSVELSRPPEGRKDKSKKANEKRTFANIVFPHPGGPYNKTPFGAPNNPADDSNS
jgi:hypothetical protein